MRLSGAGSISIPARILLNAVLVVIGFLLAMQALAVVALLVNPLHPVRHYFQVTSIVRVPAEVWQAGELVRVRPGSATVGVDPWLYLTYSPTSRAFVLVASAASYSWWACVAMVLVFLRRALTNISAGTPFLRDNVRCIRVVGWAILGMAAMHVLIGVGMVAYMRATTTIAEQPPVLPAAMLLVDFPLGTILAGLAVLILAEIFRAGSDLQDDQALTI